MAGPFQRTDPSLTAAGTLYVSTTGNDGNSGQSWDEPFATVQAALAALQGNGGLIEVGYGSFAGFVVDSHAGVHIRGRGIGREISNDGTVTAEANPTTFNSNIIVRSSQSRNESGWANGFLLEDCAVVNGSSSSWNGVGLVLGTPFAEFRRVAFDSNVSHGVMSSFVAVATAPPTGTSMTLNAVSNLPTASTYTLLFSDGEIKTGVTITNGSASVSWSGALTGAPSVYVMVIQGQGFLNTNCSWFLDFDKCRFNNNGGCAYMGMAQVTGFFNCWIEKNTGAGSGNPTTPFTGTTTANCAALDFRTIGASQEVSFFNCVIQRNVCSGIWYNGTSLQLSSNHIENNVNANGGEVTIDSGILTISGGYFVPGPSTAAYGVYFNTGGSYRLRGVGPHITTGSNWTSGFIGNNAQTGPASGASWSARLNSIMDGAIDGINTNSGNILGGTRVAGPNNNAIGTGIFAGQYIEGINQQVLSANGAVTFDASTAGNQIAVLAANASSSSITNPSPGQVLTIQWEQDNTGTRTYVWPTNCKFAGNAAPTASSTANLADIVTFKCFYTGSNYYWREVSRAVGVPTPAT